MFPGNLVKFSFFGTANSTRIGIVLEVKDNEPDLRWKPKHAKKSEWPRKVLQIYSDGKVYDTWAKHAEIIK